MATYTENYDLVKPAEEDFYSVADFNENMETIDTALAETAGQMDGMGDTLAEMNGKIGTAADTGEDTLFGLLHGGGSLIKSLQHVTFSVIAGETSGSVSINTVDPAKCFVLFERLKDTSSISSVQYTLEATSIKIKHPSLNGGTLIVGFWVIELY